MKDQDEPKCPIKLFPYGRANHLVSDYYFEKDLVRSSGHYFDQDFQCRKLATMIEHYKSINISITAHALKIG